MHSDGTAYVGIRYSNSQRYGKQLYTRANAKNMRLHDAVYRIVIVACNSSSDSMIGENRSDMFSQLRAQRLYVEGESDINQRHNRMSNSEKNDYGEGEIAQGTIDNNRVTSSENSDYVEGEIYLRSHR